MAMRQSSYGLFDLLSKQHASYLFVSQNQLTQGNYYILSIDVVLSCQ